MFVFVFLLAFFFWLFFKALLLIARLSCLFVRCHFRFFFVIRRAFFRSCNVYLVSYHTGLFFLFFFFFVSCQAFKTQEYAGREQAELYRLRFLSNVDPVDVRRTLYDLDPEETLVVVISKTFTTAETMLNARQGIVDK